MAALGIVIFHFAGCAHVQTVVTECKGTVTPDVLAKVVNAASREDYMAVIVDAAPVEECVIVAAAREVYAAVTVTVDETIKAQPAAPARALVAIQSQAADPAVVATHLKSWLASHGGTQ